MFLEEGVCYDQCILLAKLLLVFALLHSVLQGQICYSRYLLTSDVSFQSPVMSRTLLLLSVLEGLVYINRIAQLPLFQH